MRPKYTWKTLRVAVLVLLEGGRTLIPRPTPKTLLIAVAVLAVLPIFDAVGHGPYATWFNRDCQKRADEAGLVGTPEKDIATVLGPPTFHYAEDTAAERTYNYAPWPPFPTAKFQVHCRDGFVTCVEQFDD